MDLNYFLLKRQEFFSGVTSSKSTDKNRHLYLCWNGHVLENMASFGISHILDSSCYHHNPDKSKLHEILSIYC